MIEGMLGTFIGIKPLSKVGGDGVQCIGFGKDIWMD